MTEVGQPTVPEPQSAQGQPTPAGGQPAHTIVLPPELSMVTLLGPRDELLRAMEHSFPHLDIHVRGNEFHVSGAPAEVALLELATPQTPPPASDEDEELYQQLFGPPAYTPLADDDRKNYEALYGPGTGGDAA